MTKKINFFNVLRFLIVFLFLLFKYIEMWSFLFNDNFYKSKAIIFILIGISVILCLRIKLPRKLLKKIVFLGFLSLLMTILSRTIDFMVSFIFSVLYCTVDNGDKSFLKHFLISASTLFVLTILLSVLGILPQITSVRYSNGIYISRNNLGFYGANSLFLCLYPIIISYIVLNFKVKKNKDIIITLCITIFSIIFYKYTNCRAGIVCVLFILVLSNFDKVLDNNSFKKFMKYYFMIFFIISLLLTVKFGTTTDNVISTLSSGRTYYWNYYVKNVGSSMTGTEPIKGYPLDNIYLYNFYINGIICFVCYFIITLLSAKEMVRSKKLLFILVAFAIYGFFENNSAFHINFMLTIQLLYIIKNNCSTSLIDKEQNI